MYVVEFLQICDAAATCLPSHDKRITRQDSNSVDNVDLWTGGLSENHLPGAMVGQTFGAIIATQFENLRDGDRLWFQNQGFDAQTLAQIEQTTLADINKRVVLHVLGIGVTFVYYDRHSGTAGGVPSENPDAPQLVIGSAGPDTLTGGPKGDILVAGTGQQTMTGGDGADKFVFDQAGPTDATITDFRPGTDKIELDGLQHLRRGDLRVNEVNGNTVIHVGDDQITLAGVTPHQLSPQDFITVFAPTAPPSGQNSSPHAGTTDMVNNSTSQLVQAMAGFGGAGGAADALNAAPLGADTSQQNFLATPHAS